MNKGPLLDYIFCSATPVFTAAIALQAKMTGTQSCPEDQTSQTFIQSGVQMSTALQKACPGNEVLYSYGARFGLMNNAGTDG